MDNDEIKIIDKMISCEVAIKEYDELIRRCDDMIDNVRSELKNG